MTRVRLGFVGAPDEFPWVVVVAAVVVVVMVAVLGWGVYVVVTR
jgi:hypothetical protein